MTYTTEQILGLTDYELHGLVAGKLGAFIAPGYRWGDSFTLSAMLEAVPGMEVKHTLTTSCPSDQKFWAWREYKQGLALASTSALAVARWIAAYYEPPKKEPETFVRLVKCQRHSHCRAEDRVEVPDERKAERRKPAGGDRRRRTG